MPRNASGTYSLPAGRPVVAGTVISPTAENTLDSDMASEITNSLDRTGKGAMQAQLKLTDGSNAAPGVAFANETGSGLYRIGSSDVGLSISGTKRSEWTASGLLVDVAQPMTADTALTLKGNRAAGSANTDVEVDTVATRSAGAIFGIKNNTVAKAQWDSSGEPSLQGGFACGQVFKTDAAQSDGTGGTPIAITNMSFSVAANALYLWEMLIFALDNTGTGTMFLRFSGPAAATTVCYGQIPSSPVTGSAAAFDTDIDISSGASATAFPVLMTGVLENGANAGTVAAKFQLNGTGSVTVKKGAFLRWRRIA